MGHTEVVKSLLAAGANVNAQSKDGTGRTALAMAEEYGHPETAAVLRKAGGK